MTKRLKINVLDKPYFLWAMLFIIAPLVMVFYYAITDKSGAFTLQNFAQIPEYFSTILLSVLYGLAATVICLILGYPFAYFLSKHTERTQRTIVLLVMLPMWMNFLIRTYSLMTILGDTGVILGMVYNFLPYMILPIYSVLSKLDYSLLEAAQDLGSNRAHTFRRVVLPLSLPGLLSGVTMVFVPCVSTFYITQKLGGGQIVLIGDVIEAQFQTANNYHLGASLSFVLMILIFICL